MQQLKVDTGKGRNWSLDILRIISAFFVLFNHNDAFNLYKDCANLYAYAFWITVSIGCKIATPVFFMISGILLLGKEESFSCYFKKRLVRAGIILVAFSALQYIYYCMKNPMYEYGLVDFLKNIYKEPIISSYWFLYSYATFIICLPFLRRMAKQMTEAEYLYLIVLYVIFVSVLPLVEYQFASGVYIKVRLLEINLFYPLIGYYLMYRRSEKFQSVKAIVLAWAAALTGVVITAAMMYIEYKDNGAFSETYMNNYTAILAIAFFMLTLFLLSDRQLPPRASAIISVIGKATMGVYLLGNIVREVLEPVFLLMTQYVNWHIANLLYLILQFCGGVLIYYSFSRIAAFAVLHIRKREPRV